MTDSGQQGASGKRGPKPGQATIRARALLLLARGWPTERIATETGLSVKTIQNLASEHAAELREAADEAASMVRDAAVAGAVKAREKIEAAAPEAAEKLVSLMRDGGDKETAPGSAVELRAAMAILDRGGVPATSKNEHSGPGGGPIVQATAPEPSVTAIDDTIAKLQAARERLTKGDRSA